jgi:hypothetical protein
MKAHAYLAGCCGKKKQQRRKNTWKLRAISTIGIGIGN